MMLSTLLSCFLVCTQPPQPAVGILPAGAIRITANPQHLLLGEPANIALTLRATKKDGTPEDQAPPQLFVSEGTVGLVQRQAPGQFRAIYRPPAAASPRVAIILARTHTPQGTIAGWITIPLWGRGRVTVSTKPNSMVLLRVGQQAFGPVQANQAGKATIPIQVPPGPRQGIAETVDHVGNTSKKTIDLGVQPFNQIAAFALDQTVVADGSEQTAILAFAVDGRGQPLIEAPLRLTAGKGTIGDPVPMAPGVYRISYSAPRAVGRGIDRIKLRLKHAEASKALVKIGLTAGDPQRIELVVTPEVLKAGAATRPVVLVRARDSAGNTVPTSLLTIATQGGVLGVAKPGKDGASLIPLEIGDNFGGSSEVIIRAQANRGQVTAQAKVQLQPGPCQHLSLAGPRELISDGRRAEFFASCADKFGNRAALGSPDIKSSPLLIQAVESAGLGRLRIHVRTPSTLTQTQDVKLSLRNSTGLTAAVSVQLLASQGVQATIGPRLIAGWNYGPTFFTGAAVDWNLLFPLASDQLMLGLSLAALSSQIEPPSTEQSLRRLQLVPLLVRARYQTKFANLLLARAGLGAGGIFGAAFFDHTHPQRFLVTALAAEISAGTGVELGFGRLDLDLQSSFALADTKPADPGQMGHLSLSLGYQMPL